MKVYNQNNDGGHGKKQASALIKTHRARLMKARYGYHGYSQRSLAVKFQVSAMMISKAIRGIVNSKKAQAIRQFIDNLPRIEE